MIWGQKFSAIFERQGYPLTIQINMGVYGEEFMVTDLDEIFSTPQKSTP